MGDTALLHHTKLLVTQHKQGLVVLTTRFNLIRFLVSRGADLGARDANGNIAEKFARQIELRENFLAHKGGMHSSLIPGGLFATCADFLEAVRVAGSYKAYARAPRIELARLRLLCARSLASPPPVLARLFAAELPNGVFWSVLSFWRSSREIFDDEYADALTAALEDASLV